MIFTYMRNALQHNNSFCYQNDMKRIRNAGATVQILDQFLLCGIATESSSIKIVNYVKHYDFMNNNLFDMQYESI